MVNLSYSYIRLFIIAKTKWKEMKRNEWRKGFEKMAYWTRKRYGEQKSKGKKTRNGVDENERRSTVSYRSHEITMSVWVCVCLSYRKNERNLTEKDSLTEWIYKTKKVL